MRWYRRAGCRPSGTLYARYGGVVRLRKLAWLTLQLRCYVCPSGRITFCLIPIQFNGKSLRGRHLRARCQISHATITYAQFKNGARFHVTLWTPRGVCCVNGGSQSAVSILPGTRVKHSDVIVQWIVEHIIAYACLKSARILKRKLFVQWLMSQWAQILTHCFAGI